jgi:hypothetical protein
MCNDYRLMVDLDTVAQDFEGIRIRLSYPEGIPNLTPPGHPDDGERADHPSWRRGRHR